MEQKASKLLPIRHPTGDMFIADIFDALPIKDDIASMGVPFFSLSKKKDLRTIEYEKNDVQVKVSPSFEHGLPTIFDKDLLLYVSSYLMDMLNKRNQAINKESLQAAEKERERVKSLYQGEVLESYLERYQENYCLEQQRLRPIPKTIRIAPHDYLVATNRETNGKSYRLFDKSLARLTGVMITTNIETGGIRQKDYFHIIEKATYIESPFVKDRRVGLEITLSDWYYNSIISKEVLTINPEYFRIGGAIERRLYEISRKHCGRQENWEIDLENLKGKVGSRSNLTKFRYFIRQIADENYLPDYMINIANNDLVTITNRNFCTQNNQLSMDMIQPLLKLETREKARQIVFEAGTNWDYDALEEQFTTSVSQGKFTPDNNDAAFIGFVRKKVEKWA